MQYRHYLPPALLLATLSLGACDSSGEANWSEADFDRIENGMSEEEVYAIMGEPSASSDMAGDELNGRSAVWEDDSTRVTIQFVDGVVRVKQFTHSEDDPVVR